MGEVEGNNRKCTEILRQLPACKLEKRPKSLRAQYQTNCRNTYCLVFHSGKGGAGRAAEAEEPSSLRLSLMPAQGCDTKRVVELMHFECNLDARQNNPLFLGLL